MVISNLFKHVHTYMEIQYRRQKQSLYNSKLQRQYLVWPPLLFNIATLLGKLIISVSSVQTKFSGLLQGHSNLFFCMLDVCFCFVLWQDDDRTLWEERRGEAFLCVLFCCFTSLVVCMGSLPCWKMALFPIRCFQMVLHGGSKSKGTFLPSWVLNAP